MLFERKLKQAPVGRPTAPLTRLKGLSPEVQAGVMWILRDHTYEQAPPFVEALVGFAVSEDTLERFYAWQSTRRVMGCAEETMSEVIEFIKEHYTDWTEEKMREAASAFFMAKTIQKQDARSFACVAQLGLKSNRDKIEARKLEFEKVKLERRAELTAKRLELDHAKFKWSQQKQTDIAMEALGDEFRENPEAMTLYRKAKEALRGRGENAECGSRSAELKAAEQPTSDGGVVSSDLQAEREKLCQVLRGIAVMKESNATENDGCRITNGEATHFENIDSNGESDEGNGNIEHSIPMESGNIHHPEKQMTNMATVAGACRT